MRSGTRQDLLVESDLGPVLIPDAAGVLCLSYGRRKGEILRRQFGVTNGSAMRASAMLPSDRH